MTVDDAVLLERWAAKLPAHGSVTINQKDGAVSNVDVRLIFTEAPRELVAASSR